MRESDRSIHEKVAALAGHKILVIGDAMLDRHIFGGVERISPEGPVPVLKVEHEGESVGGAANAAAKAAGLECDCTLISLVGDDATGQSLQKLIQLLGIDSSGIVVSQHRRTTVKTRYWAMRQQLMRADDESPAQISEEDENKLIEKISEFIGSAEALLISDYGKGVCSKRVLQSAIAAAKGGAIPIVVDPKGVNYSIYKEATVLTPNKLEAETASGIKIDDEASLLAAARKINRTAKVDCIAITRGPDGVSALKKGARKMEHFPTHKLEVFDVTGAGDAAAAATTAALAAGMDIADALQMANAAGGAIVQQIGVGVLDHRRMLEVLDAQARPVGSKIIDDSQAWEIRRRVATKGKKVVFTNGCFDLLHAGHISLLEKAKAFGDVLIVGMNSDSSVSALKGKGRPVIKECDRARLLAALSVVDYVVIFDSDSVLSLIRLLQPDVLVKGGDYAMEDVVGAEFVVNEGGTVELVPLMKGMSSSAIVDKIKTDTNSEDETE